MHGWARGSGLQVITSIAPHQSQVDAQSWDPRDALALISVSDKEGYNASWQLGYGKFIPSIIYFFRRLSRYSREPAIISRFPSPSIFCTSQQSPFALVAEHVIWDQGIIWLNKKEIPSLQNASLLPDYRSSLFIAGKALMKIRQFSAWTF